MNYMKMQQHSRTIKGKDGRTISVPSAGKELEHCGRTEGDRERGNERIDPERTHLNYDLAEELRGGLSAKEFFDQKLTATKKDYKEKNKKEMRKDTCVLFSWVITAPQDLPPEKIDDFMEESFNWWLETYGKERLIQAAVHLDETTPHIHIEGMPFVKDEKNGGFKLLGKDFETPKTLREKQIKCQEYLTEKLGCSVNIINGATAGGNKTVQELKAKDAAEKAAAEAKKAAELQRQARELLERVNDLTEQAEQAKKEVEEVKKNAEQQIKEIKENAEQQIKAYKEKAAEAESSIVNLLDSVQPFEPEQKKPKPNLPEKYDWSKRPPAGRKRNKWDNNRDKEQQKIDKEYERYCAEVDERNAANLLKWQEANLTADNLRKAKAMLDKVKTELDERQAALTQDKAQLKQNLSEFESTVDDFEGYVEGKVKERTAELTAENGKLKMTVMQQQSQIDELTAENDELREELYPSKDYDYGR